MDQDLGTFQLFERPFYVNFLTEMLNKLGKY